MGVHINPVSRFSLRNIGIVHEISSSAMLFNNNQKIVSHVPVKQSFELMDIKYY